MAKRAEKKEKGNKKIGENVKEIKSKVSEIKVIKSEKKENKSEKSILEKEIEEKDLVFSPPPSSTPSSETPITLLPTSPPQQQLEEVLPIERTQFQKEDQRNFSQSISYSSNNPYQQSSGQRTYQSSAASAPQQQSQGQEDLMRTTESSMAKSTIQRLTTLLPSNNEPIVRFSNDIERPQLQRERQETQSRYSYKEKNITEVNKRRRDMF